MPRNRRATGDGKVGCIVWLVAMLILGMIGWKMIPVKLNSVELYDFMEEQAKFAGKAGPDEIKREVIKKAAELELPVDPKNVKVVRVGGRVRIECTYSVPIDLIAKKFDWEFEYKVDRPVYIY